MLPMRNRKTGMRQNPTPTLANPTLTNLADAYSHTFQPPHFPTPTLAYPRHANNDLFLPLLLITSNK